MGRRSVSSTKTGKFMNPTDQARKEARRKELKKNKKQRQIVRQAVLKGKDPKQIMVEMEALDKMEYDPNNPPPYNVKVLQDKRKKLKETWVKLFRLYENDDPKYFSELRGMELEYEKKKSQMVAIYESVKKAEKVKLEDIPLPDAPSNLAAIAMMQTCDIPLPPPPSTTQSVISAPPVLNQKGILKKSTEKDPNRKPPGPPPGPPPPLSEFECDDDEKELGITADENIKNKGKKLRFADDSSKSEPVSVTATINALKSQMNQPLAAAAAASMAPPPPMPGYPPMRPPGLIQSQMGGYRTAFPPPPVPSSLSSMQQRLAAQSVLQQQAVSRQAALLSQQQQQTSYSAPAVTSRAPQPADDRTSSKIIEAKPVLRNKMAEITRFVPTSLMVKRDQKQKTKSNVDYGYAPQASSNLPAYAFASNAASSTDNKQGSTTDIAYDQFMKEINKLL